MVEVIERGEPAIMASHWTGIYFNGREEGFQTFQEVVRRLHVKYDHLLWMKLGEIARYWAARELTCIEKQGGTVTFQAPFASPSFTVHIAAQGDARPQLTIGDKPQGLTEVAKCLDLKPGTWTGDRQGVIVCFDLPKGRSEVKV